MRLCIYYNNKGKMSTSLLPCLSKLNSGFECIVVTVSTLNLVRRRQISREGLEVRYDESF